MHRSALGASGIRRALCETDRRVACNANSFRSGAPTVDDGTRRTAVKILHEIFGQHVPQVTANHWENGRFVSRCLICDCTITRLPGLPWSRADRRRSGER
jgi:hypothetical protein